MIALSSAVVVTSMVAGFGFMAVWCFQLSRNAERWTTLIASGGMFAISAITALAEWQLH